AFEDERQGEEIVFGIALLLPAVGVQILAEIAFPVHQADADERHAEVARTLQVIAGQNAETAGIDWDAFVDAEFGGEISDADAAGPVVERVLEPGSATEIGVEALD